MALQSTLFRGDSKLEAAAVSDPAHVFQGARGAHVALIQQALVRLDGAAIAVDASYGPGTTAAVIAFKRRRQIVNARGQIDGIVGKKTVAALDAELLAGEKATTVGGNRRSLVGPIKVTATHTLVYFSGVADDAGLGGLPLLDDQGQDVLKDMKALTTVNSDKRVFGFGGSLANRQLGVQAALAAILSSHDRRGRLIVYGFSAGGVNALDLCRNLASNPLTAGLVVDLLVTVDVAARKEFVDRSVPDNVRLNRNYFQTSPSGNGSRGGPAFGRARIDNIAKDGKFPFGVLPFAQHGGMQDLTRGEARNDMQTALTAVRP